MHPIPTLMHALSSPDDYIFDWRNGELFIALRAPSVAQDTGRGQAVRQAIVNRSRNAVPAHA